MILWTIAWRVAIVAVLWLAAFASMAQTVRPDVGKPLQAAQEALNADRPTDALARIAEATAVPDLTPDERYVIARLRGAAASAAGDLDTAATAFDSALADPRMTAADRDRTLRTLTAAFYKAKRYANAAAWGERALREQPGDRNLRVLVAQSKYLQDDWAGAAATLQVGVDEDQRAGKAPPQDVLQLLLNARFKQKDGNGVQRALEALVRYHPTPEYWADLIDQVRGQPGFAPRLALDAWRLHAQTRSLLNAEDHVEMIEASLKAGYPAEAQQVVDRGFAAGLLGKGPASGEHQTLRERVRRLMAEDRAAAAAGRDARDPTDANARAATGMNDVLNGRTERGLALLQQSLVGAGPRHPEQVRLQLGMALWWAGKKAEAIEAFKAVKGDDGSTALARLWLLLAEANTPAPSGAS